MSLKLVGYRFSPTVQEVLHVVEASGAPVELQDVHWDDEETRKTLYPKSPTGTLPYLETKEGVLSESKAIELYLAETYKPELLGEGDLQKAQVRQWMDFASFELGDCAQKIVYPLFGWKPYCKESADQANNRLKEFMKALDQQVKGKRYAFGEELTLADIALFNKLKFFFQLVFPKALREKVFPNVNDWFLRVLNTPETDKVYGKVLLCNQPLKPFISEKKEEKHQDKGKKGNEGKDKKDNAKKQETPEEPAPEKQKKKQNPLDLLPPSKLELETFKRAFLNNKDKEDAIKKFWEVYDPEGYSLWRLEYDNLPTECKVLFRTSNSKGMFLQKCDNLRRYAFAVHGVYGVEDDYKIRGLWMFRGLEVPQEMKDNDLYEYIHFRKLDHTNEEDRKLVHDYWTKFDENDEVEGRKCADVSFFN
jgi:elongation factor 1-gamma